MNKENIEPKNQIKTAEEILNGDRYHSRFKLLNSNDKNRVTDAMEEYASQFKAPAISSNEGETVEASNQNDRLLKEQFNRNTNTELLPNGKFESKCIYKHISYAATGNDEQESRINLFEKISEAVEATNVQEGKETKRYVASASCGNSIDIIEIINDNERVIAEIISNVEWSTTENWQDAKTIELALNKAGQSQHSYTEATCKKCTLQSGNISYSEAEVLAICEKLLSIVAYHTKDDETRSMIEYVPEILEKFRSK